MNSKKILTGVLAGSMVAAMTVSAFAAEAECSYIDGTTASYTCKVGSGVSTLTVNVKYADAVDDGSTFGCNDWCANGVIVKATDGTEKYYQWGGSSVGWGWDVDGDEADDTEKGYNTDTWVGTIDSSAGTATLQIPVSDGATVEFYTLGWDTYSGVQFTLSIDDASLATGDVAPVAYLAAIVAVAGIAMVASKKVRA